METPLVFYGHDPQPPIISNPTAVIPHACAQGIRHGGKNFFLSLWGHAIQILGKKLGHPAGKAFFPAFERGGPVVFFRQPHRKPVAAQQGRIFLRRGKIKTLAVQMRRANAFPRQHGLAARIRPILPCAPNSHTSRPPGRSARAMTAVRRS